MKQPEALQLAELLESPGYGYHTTPAQCAAELRRLHEANQAMLEALNWIANQTYDPWTNGAEAQRHAIAAIAKGEAK